MDFSLSDSKRRTKKDSIIRTKRQGLQLQVAKAPSAPSAPHNTIKISTQDRTHAQILPIPAQL